MTAEISISQSKSSCFRLQHTPFGVIEMFDILPQHPSDRNRVILLTPGNPGVVLIYEKFLKSLYSALNAQFRVIVAGHLGHSKNDLNQGRLFSNEQQVGKIIHIMELLQKEYQNSVEIVLIGHSLGSFYNLHVLSKRPDLPVLFTFHLFPVICQLNLSLAFKLMCIPKLRKLASLFISKLPQSTKIGFVRTISSYASQEAELAVGYSQNTTFLENVIFTGDDAMQMLREEVDEELAETARKFRDQSLYVYTPLDRYVSKKVFLHHKQMLKFGEMYVRLKKEEEVDHAFIINNNFMVVTKICVNALRDKRLIE